MRLKLKTITHYQIDSRQIYIGSYLAFLVLIGLILLAELLVDLRSTWPGILITFLVLTSIGTYLAYRFSNVRALRSSLPLLMYTILEIHFFISATTFHVIIYWLPLVPLAALIVQGLRTSLAWFAITLVTHCVNYYVLTSTIGESYELSINTMAFFAASIIFLTGILAAAYLLYALLGNAYVVVNERNAKIGLMNDKLGVLNKELATVNESLEIAVRKRTAELEIQNKQLAEYAFINAHLLRAPISRIIGLSHLITREVTSVKEIELMNALAVSTDELDSIIKKMGELLKDTTHLTPEEIKSIVEKLRS